jgi:signal transduction histidine kinase
LVEQNIEEPIVIVKCFTKNSSAIISIEDNGGGVPLDIISKVFEPYFTTKHKSQGTGLGLHMSYKIITESLHGKIYVENTNLGAKFIIELPLNDEVQN